MVTLFDTGQTKAQNESAQMNQLETLSDDELRDLFVRATDILKSKGISHSSTAEKVGLKVPSMNPRRMRNIRYGNISPYVNEVQAIFDAYPDKLKTLRDEIGQPSPDERRLNELEERLEKQEEFVQVERIAMLAEIARLREKLEEYKKRLGEDE